MKRHYSASVILALLLLISVPATVTAEEKTEVLCTSPSGGFSVELTPVEPSATDPDARGNVWVVSTKDPTQRAKLPKQSPDSPTDDEIHFSPNEEWIFGLRHVGSGLRYGNVYHLARPLKIDLPTNDTSFNDLIWKNCVKLGALKHDYSAEGVYAMTLFVAWSFDSSRLLIRLRGGEEKRSMQPGLLYFNTRTKKFEITDYLRKLNKSKSGALACAEPVDPLPGEAELRKRLEVLDGQLNKKYAEVIAQAQDGASNVRDAQRNWIKHRDEGAKMYLLTFPATGKERRRLQFLGDVTASRIDTPAQEWAL